VPLDTYAGVEADGSLTVLRGRELPDVDNRQLADIIGFGLEDGHRSGAPPDLPRKRTWLAGESGE